MRVIPQYFQQDMPAISRPDEAPSLSTSRPLHKHRFPSPKLRLHLNDLSHDGSSVFLSRIHGGEDLEAQVQEVLNLLYTADSIRTGTRSVTVILRSFNGIAYTTGIDLDGDHKEMHVSLDYIAKVKDSRQEILGVICHELVHCFQWAAEGTCPGGLIEGIADWVRLRAGLAAKHWKQEAKGNWDAGYQHTGYFLEYLEQRFGAGTVRKINESLRQGKYDETKLFTSCCGGKRVDELWKDYAEELNKHTPSENQSSFSREPSIVPTHTPGLRPQEAR